MQNNFLQPTLKGESVTLIPLELSHFEKLYQAASDPLIWAGHPSKDRYKKDVFTNLFEDSMDSKGAMVIIENSSGRFLGSTRFYNYDEAKSELCVGYTFLIREVWGGKTNREVKTLVLQHAFQYVSTVWFHVDKSNLRSQAAMKKIGATLSHEEDVEFNGQVSRYVFFKMEKGEE